MESLRLDSQILPLVDSSQLSLGAGREGGVCKENSSYWCLELG